jgi:hypothetical protein
MTTRWSQIASAISRALRDRQLRRVARARLLRLAARAHGGRSLDVRGEPLPRGCGCSAPSHVADARSQTRCVGGHRVARTCQESLGVDQQVQRIRLGRQIQNRVQEN